ncbi:MAG: NADH-quinone oxidoreductase subunit C [Elusimicrobia bacterium]|nr:NADH-quinone oxidoreductase subunit C [Elusimicrobiota bacterium]
MAAVEEALTKEALAADLAAAFPDVQPDKAQVSEYLTLRLPSADRLLPVVRHLKETLGFANLDMLTAVDWQGPVSLDGFVRDPNFNVFLAEGATPQAEAPKKTANVDYREAVELVYLLGNYARRAKVFLKLDVPRKDGRAPSLVGAYKSADWQEREVFDLFGVRFDGHPDLRKILTPDFTVGHPLLKDYVHQKDKYD